MNDYKEALELAKEYGRPTASTGKGTWIEVERHDIALVSQALVRAVGELEDASDVAAGLESLLEVMQGKLAKAHEDLGKINVEIVRGEVLYGRLAKPEGRGNHGGIWGWNGIPSKTDDHKGILIRIEPFDGRAYFSDRDKEGG